MCILLTCPTVRTDAASSLSRLCRVPAGRLTTTCSGTTITSPPTSFRCLRISCATLTCAAPAPFPFRRPPTTPIWWLFAPAITWWTKSTTGEDDSGRRPARAQPIAHPVSTPHDNRSRISHFSVPRAATHQVRATGVTNKPWPKPFRSTRTPCAQCTSPESAGRRAGVGQGPPAEETHYPPFAVRLSAVCFYSVSSLSKTTGRYPSLIHSL